MRSSSWLTSLIRPGLVLIVLAPSSVSVLNITNVATVLPSLWKNSASTARYWHGHLQYPPFRLDRPEPRGQQHALLTDYDERPAGVWRGRRGGGGLVENP